MSSRRFGMLAAAGTLARLALIWVVGETFTTPFDWLLEVVTANKVAITAVLAGALVLQLQRGRRRNS